MKTQLIPSLLLATLLIPSSAQTPVPPAVPAGTPPAQNADPCLQALGASGGQAMLTTYMSITELADLHGAKAYDNAKVLQLATMYQNLTANTKGSLTSLLSGGTLKKDDAASVQQMANINDLLGKLSQDLINYINDPSAANQATFEKDREAALKLITSALGIQAS